ncbi:tocopherol cyclase family protein [Alkaliphilus serpentinus]|uniref:Tocopherol cyclase n=1 Tax=Alkaliphilus serpentinus TaxID=1482731 RepID=A0A833HQ98_9FIRM|nr:tocopherol cyclase family protein [Alkaliphilus serpentinus]KAB3531552.1 hypothetical protein F8153_05090 [Alkaliphilus serpentinus]
MYRLNKLWKPEVYQGLHKRGPYFEGWYFKNTGKDGSCCWSFIPGISLTKNYVDNHCFIQAIDGITGDSWYITYPINEFKASTDKLEIRIGDSVFSREGIDLNIKKDSFECRGSLKYSNIINYPKRLLAPGIMGWYSFVPFMECYHGIVSINHQVKGSLTINNHLQDFNGGKGYIEKDWGKSFPSSWIWMQSNNFHNEEASLMVSIAKIPWMAHSFVGFLSFIYVDNQLYSFATYNGGRVSEISYIDDKIHIEIENKSYMLHINGGYTEGGNLQAPTPKGMNRRIKESISSILDVRLLEKGGRVIFSSTGLNSGMEVCGDIEELIPKK